jgi:asparagine synthase (glutamine-hydrolysing)
VNTYFICVYAKQYGLKAVLSGLGADELFGGYASFNREGMIANMQKIPAPVLKMASYLPQDKYRKVSFLSRKDAVGEYLFHRGFFHAGETARILNADIRQVSETLQEINMPAFVDALPYGNKVSYLESNLYMQCQLLRDTDMMSMWHSIEVRVPYLDTDLVNLVNSIAPSVKFNSKQIKHLLIESFADILPQEIWNRKKQGFVFPFQRWMEGNENKSFKKADTRISERYKSGKLNWSRYWAYLIANNYEVV